MERLQANETVEKKDPLPRFRLKIGEKRRNRLIFAENRRGALPCPEHRCGCEAECTKRWKRKRTLSFSQPGAVLCNTFSRFHRRNGALCRSGTDAVEGAAEARHQNRTDGNFCRVSGQEREHAEQQGIPDAPFCEKNEPDGAHKIENGSAK